MGDFFNGWRRKAGLVTLTMSMLLAVAWIRSFIVFDTVSFTISEFQHRIRSVHGHVIWHSWVLDGGESNTEWTSKHADSRLSFMYENWMIEFESQILSKREERRFGEWAAAYWSLILLLTLLSGWLILGKPRKTDSR